MYFCVFKLNIIMAGITLLYYRAIAAISNSCLAPQGKGIVEINECLGKETEALFREAGYPLTEVVKDFYEKNRFILFEK